MTGRSPPKDLLSSVQVALNKVQLPSKKYFKIGEVAHLVGVEPHVLRYWQTQFPQVRPQKSRSGHRLYRRKDVETLLAVKELLHVQRFTIAGARLALRSASLQSDVPSEITSDLTSLLSLGPDDALADEDFDEGAVDDDDDLPMSEGLPVTEIELVAVDGSELRAALDAELHEQRGLAMEVVEIGEDEPTLSPVVVPDSAPMPATRGLAATADQAARLLASTASAPAHGGLSAPGRAPYAIDVSADSGNGNGRPHGPAQHAASVETATRTQSGRVEQRVVERAPVERTQLGLGFSPNARAALAAAREELVDVLRTLDAYVPADRRRGGTGRR
jgi:DNA-binding transcriptional MerR regulator